MQTVDFFFYGTLRDAEVRRVVFGLGARHGASVAARLHGYRAVPGPLGRYPILIVDAESTADGLLLPGVELAAAARVSYFETDGYEYVPGLVEIDTADGRRPAWVYLAGPEARPEAGRWSFDEWKRQHRAAFLRNAHAAMQSCSGQAVATYRKDWVKRLRAAARPDLA
jgi:gamma-glutamylcyclotransferase (GGCT)/AIG2-like uncharacterized protein YtfP